MDPAAQANVTKPLDWQTYAYPFIYGQVDHNLFPLAEWRDCARQALGKNEPVGRRLDFLMQELNREANTLGSKSADTETTRAAVELKVLIEQMREQVQNVE